MTGDPGRRRWLVEFIETQLPENTLIDADTSLIRSGLLDSLGLMNLALRIEEEIGRGLDPTSVDLVRAWDTVAAIDAFIEAQRRFGKGDE